MAFEEHKAFYVNDRLRPLVTIVSATVSFILSLIVVLSSAENGQLQQYHLVMLNTSTLLQNAIIIENASSVTARAAVLTYAVPTPTIEPRQFSIPGVSVISSIPIISSVSEIPSFSEISSFFASIGSALTNSATTTQPSSATGTASATQPSSATGTASAAQPSSATGTASAAQPSSDTGTASATQPSSATGTASAAQPSSATLSSSTTPTSSATQLSSPTGAASATGIASTDLLIGDLESFMSDLFSNSVSGEDSQAAENKVMDDVISVFGIKQWYALYMNQFCDGNYDPSYSASNATLNLSSCTKFDQIHGNQSKLAFQLGNKVLDFSALNIPNKLANGAGQVHRTLTAIFVLQIIGIVASGVLIPLTLLYLLLALFQEWSVRIIILGLTSVAAACFGFIAVVETAIMISIKSVVNGVGDGLGIEAYGGGSFIALLWVSFALTLLSSILWFVLWHDDTYARRDEGPKQQALAETANSNFPQPALMSYGDENRLLPTRN